jgi:hypothetical protein
MSDWWCSANCGPRKNAIWHGQVLPFCRRTRGSGRCIHRSALRAVLRMTTLVAGRAIVLDSREGCRADRSGLAKASASISGSPVSRGALLPIQTASAGLPGFRPYPYLPPGSCHVTSGSVLWIGVVTGCHQSDLPVLPVSYFINRAPALDSEGQAVFGWRSGKVADFVGVAHLVDDDDGAVRDFNGRHLGPLRGLEREARQSVERDGHRALRGEGAAARLYLCGAQKLCPATADAPVCTPAW